MKIQNPIDKYEASSLARPEDLLGLTLGATGKPVEALQGFLNQFGYLSIIDRDKKFNVPAATPFKSTGLQFAAPAQMPDVQPTPVGGSGKWTARPSLRCGRSRSATAFVTPAWLTRRRS